MNTSSAKANTGRQTHHIRGGWPPCISIADLLFADGPIYTADPRQPWVEAVAVREGRILATGRAADLAELCGPGTERVNLTGRLLLPGFTESHVHFIELALRTAQVDATDRPHLHTRVAEMVRARVAQDPPAQPDTWILGAGWHASSWTDGVRPHRALLDAVSPDIPVALDSKDLHSIWLNSAALRRAGITAATTGDIGWGHRTRCNRRTDRHFARERSQPGLIAPFPSRT